MFQKLLVFSIGAFFACTNVMAQDLDSPVEQNSDDTVTYEFDSNDGNRNARPENDPESPERYDERDLDVIEENEDGFGKDLSDGSIDPLNNPEAFKCPGCKEIEDALKQKQAELDALKKTQEALVKQKAAADKAVEQAEKNRENAEKDLENFNNPKSSASSDGRTVDSSDLEARASLSAACWAAYSDGTASAQQTQDCWNNISDADIAAEKAKLKAAKEKAVEKAKEAEGKAKKVQKDVADQIAEVDKAYEKCAKKLEDLKKELEKCKKKCPPIEDQYSFDSFFDIFSDLDVGGVIGEAREQLYGPPIVLPTPEPLSPEDLQAILDALDKITGRMKDAEIEQSDDEIDEAIRDGISAVEDLLKQFNTEEDKAPITPEEWKDWFEDLDEDKENFYELTPQEQMEKLIQRIGAEPEEESESALAGDPAFQEFVKKLQESLEESEEGGEFTPPQFEGEPIPTGDGGFLVLPVPQQPVLGLQAPCPKCQPILDKIKEKQNEIKVLQNTQASLQKKSAKLGKAMATAQARVDNLKEALDRMNNPPSSASSNGRTVDSADLEARRAAMAHAWGQYQGGGMTAQELQDYWNNFDDVERDKWKQKVKDDLAKDIKKAEQAVKDVKDQKEKVDKELDDIAKKLEKCEKRLKELQEDYEKCKKKCENGKTTLGFFDKVGGFFDDLFSPKPIDTAEHIQDVVEMLVTPPLVLPPPADDVAPEDQKETENRTIVFENLNIYIPAGQTVEFVVDMPVEVIKTGDITVNLDANQNLVVSEVGGSEEGGVKVELEDEIRFEFNIEEEPKVLPPVLILDDTMEGMLPGPKIEVDKDGGIKVSNLGSSGQDGYSIELPKDQFVNTNLSGYDFTATLESRKIKGPNEDNENPYAMDIQALQEEYGQPIIGLGSEGEPVSPNGTRFPPTPAYDGRDFNFTPGGPVFVPGGFNPPNGVPTTPPVGFDPLTDLNRGIGGNGTLMITPDGTLYLSGVQNNGSGPFLIGDNLGSSGQDGVDFFRPLLLHFPDEVGDGELQADGTLLPAPKGPRRFSADLSINKTANVTSVKPGGSIKYTLTVTNGGPNSTTGVELTEHIPSCLEIIWSDGTFDNSTQVWSIGALGVGESKTLNIEVRVGDDCRGELTNRAEITHSALPDPDDMIDILREGDILQDGPNTAGTGVDDIGGTGSNDVIQGGGIYQGDGLGVGGLPTGTGYAGDGGGIYNGGGTLELDNSTISGNSGAPEGGGLWNDNPTGNTTGGGIYTGDGVGTGGLTTGGGIFNDDPSEDPKCNNPGESTFAGGCIACMNNQICAPSRTDRGTQCYGCKDQCQFGVHASNSCNGQCGANEACVPTDTSNTCFECIARPQDIAPACPSGSFERSGCTACDAGCESVPYIGDDVLPCFKCKDDEEEVPNYCKDGEFQDSNCGGSCGSNQVCNAVESIAATCYACQDRPTTGGGGDGGGGITTGGGEIIITPPPVEEQTCEEKCAQHGFTATEIDFTTQVEAQLNSVSCVSSYSMQIQTATVGGCQCYPTTPPTVNFDTTPPVCTGTPCGDVACGQSASCPTGENTTTTVTCNWGGWQKQQRYKYAPVIGGSQ